MHTDPSLSTSQWNGEILLWQARFRRGFAAAVGFAALIFKATGLLSAESILSPLIGSVNALIVGAAAVAAYLIFCEIVTRHVQRTGQAGTRLLHSVLVADLVLIFVILGAVTPPVQYSRGLLLAVFLVQYARLYFGMRAAVVSLVASTAGYGVLVFLATNSGRLEHPEEEFWNLAIFLIGALMLGLLQGQVTGRLDRVLALFDRAQEGDFSTPYDDSLDRMPDPITLVGRAYNRMRVRLEAMVLTDPLSGCFNRRGFDQLCAREASRAIRGKHAMAMLAIDVDHFKLINDEFGHLTGDEVLREMGARLRETARAGDVVARIGGEEFEVLAPDTSAEGAQILADRLQAAFRKRPFQSLGGTRIIGISIGIASAVAESDQIVGQLIARADEALYVAKRNGRDRSQMWEPGLRAFDGALPGRRSIEINALRQ
ncbi:MAG: GGDEF domain-containing protein [Gemmatimonadaceae bacterium]|nr:GGDEF domain-containing protein [Gemmatimonadaceae bacterium]